MDYKNISLREQTYRKLRRIKGDDESFSDLIERLLGDEEEHPLFELIGVLDEEEARRLRRRSKQFRRRVSDRISPEENHDR